MLSFNDKKVLSVKILMSLILMCISILTFAQQDLTVSQFNAITEQVEELKKTDLSLSLKKLTPFESQLDNLNTEQKLIYFKLLSEIYIEQNKYTTALKSVNEGLKVAKDLTSPSILISEILYLKGFAYESLEDMPQATKEYKKGLDIADSLHNKVQIAAGLINLGAIAYLTGDYERSLVLLHDAFNIAIQTDDEELKGTVNTELGIVYSHLVEDEQSMAYYQQSYVHFKKAGMLLAAHNSLNNIAINHIYNQNYQQAIEVFNTIITESNKDSPSDGMYTVYTGMSWAHLSKEDSNPEAAYEYLLMAKQYLQFTEKQNYKMQYLVDEANVLYQLERYDEALESIEKFEQLMLESKDISLVKRQNYTYLIEVKASVFNKKKLFQKAYETQTRVIELTNKLYENEDNRSIAEVRLRLEAEQADKTNKRLHSQQELYEGNLLQAKKESEQQRFFLIISALIALAFAWVLIKLIQSQHKLKVASSIDSLTGVKNRRSVMKKSQQAFKVAQAKATSLSILMIDVDHFKKINDSLGHSSGDKVLAQVAKLGESMMRKSDIYGRLGGEEFLVCLPKSNLSAAREIGERLRANIAKHSWQFGGLDTVTVSIGVASLDGDIDLLTLIKRADEQLYHAKASGRNKVCG